MGAQQSQIQSLLKQKSDLKNEKKHFEADLLLPNIAQGLGRRGQTLGDMLAEQKYIDKAKQRINEINQLIIAIENELSTFPSELVKKVKRGMSKRTPKQIQFSIGQVQSSLEMLKGQLQVSRDAGVPIEQLRRLIDTIKEREEELTELLELSTENYVETHYD